MFFDQQVDRRTSININILHRHRIMLNTIKFNNSQVMSVDGEGKEGTTGDGDDAEAVG
jgi:hypothetical protein